ncbi:hypothetical protein [Actinophytocola sp.]|uniref:hypothetical protein n=1 Tax=Actinophytocola sp. TaxID=1872138 RepID=UPI002D7FA9B0|nr:hypothetical protein [Actinophytocola sp.]HET9142034.1 hypothetical protein [Actinophytocola sp.]
MLDPGAGGPAIAGAAAGAAIGASMMQFAQTAASGGFAVNETGGQALLSAIRNMRDGIALIQSDWAFANRNIPLGQSHGANVMTKVDTDVGQDDQGFMPMLTRLMESLEAAEQGINDAMRNYQAMEEQGAARQQSI